MKIYTVGQKILSPTTIIKRSFSMSERFRTTRVFYLGAAILTLIAAVLRTLSLSLCLDRNLFLVGERSFRRL